MSVGSDGCAAPVRILIVDDVLENCELLQLVLNWEGFVTEIATTGEEALASVAAAPPDLMLLDLGLPGLSGYEVTIRMKANVATKDIPVMIISGSGDDRTRLRVLSAGAGDFILKPIDRKDLSQRIRNTLCLKAAGPPQTIGATSGAASGASSS